MQLSYTRKGWCGGSESIAAGNGKNSGEFGSRNGPDGRSNSIPKNWRRQSLGVGSVDRTQRPGNCRNSSPTDDNSELNCGGTAASTRAACGGKFRAKSDAKAHSKRPDPIDHTHSLPSN